MKPWQKNMRTRVGEINKQITAAESWRVILDIAMEHSTIYDSVNTSTSLHRIAKQRPSENDMEVGCVFPLGLQFGRVYIGSGI